MIDKISSRFRARLRAIRPTLSMVGGPWGDDGSGDDGAKAPGERGRPPRKASPWLPDENGPGRPNGGFDSLWKGRGFGGNLPPMVQGVNWWKWGGILLVALWIVGTSVHRLEAEEEGVVTRLGSYSRTVGPGISLTLPAPLESMIKIPARRIQTIDIPGSDAQNLVLTGDANIINLAYTVRWSVKQPRLFAFQLNNPETAIRSAAESAMRSTVANFNLAQAIGSGQTEISRDVEQRLQAILDYYRSGVRVEDVSIRVSAPPNEVEEAFNNVNVARQNSEAAINGARGFAAQIVNAAQGDAAEFDRIYEQYRLSPQVTRRRLYYETMEQVLRPSEKTIIDSNNLVPYLPLPEARRTAEPAANPSTTATVAGGGQ